jgi:methionyl-tRNA formyltransferase
MADRCRTAIQAHHSINPCDNPDLCVLVNYPIILTLEEIAKYPMGVINLHYSKLPYYRGRHPIVWAMINGEPEIGITVHYVDGGIDTGDIILQRTIPLGINDKYADILARAEDVGLTLLTNAVDMIAMERVQRIPQSEAGTYYPRRTPEDSRIPIEIAYDPKATARFINALSDPMPNAFVEIDGHRIYYKGARYEDRTRLSI